MQTDVANSDFRSVPQSEFAMRAAEMIALEIQKTLASREVCRVALAGGETPRAIHEVLAARRDAIDWQRVWITFGDERCVPPEDAASNYRMAKESLLSRVPIDPAHVLRIQGELPPEQAAEEYERVLAGAGSELREGRYVHDLMLLGMGEDGHTASLFPGSPSLEERDRSVVATVGTKPPPNRITMTLPLLNASRAVYFLVTGKAKAPVLKKVLAGVQDYPTARVKPANGRLTWLVSDDLAAAIRE